jgi:hypothetical protein
VNTGLTRYDHLVHFWCPQLGQTMAFVYCRRAQDGMPCAKVLQCFDRRFNVAAYLEENFTPGERARFLGPQPGRLDRLAKALDGARGQAKKPPTDPE